MHTPDEPENEMKAAARRYDSDEDFRRVVDGDDARNLTGDDIDWDSLPELDPRD